MESIDITKIKEYCDPIFIKDDDSETNSLDYDDFSLSPNDIVLTDGFSNYCIEKCISDGRRFIYLTSRYYNASYLCIIDEYHDKHELFISKQKFTEEKLNELYNKLVHFKKNEKDIRSFITADFPYL